MSHQLKRFRFKESDLDLSEVKHFTCGPNPWEEEVAVWLKSRSGDNSVLKDIKEYGTEVWLYRTTEGELVGYASLGECRWSIPMPKGPKQLISVIPFIGVHQKFQGEPKGVERDDMFAYQILDDLIEYAAEKTASAKAASRHLLPYIGLSVDQRNRRAISFYSNRDFKDTESPRKTPTAVYDRMVLNITHLVVSPPYPD